MRLILVCLSDHTKITVTQTIGCKIKQLDVQSNDWMYDQTIGCTIKRLDVRSNH